jgi:hypothetical protein
MTVPTEQVVLGRVDLSLIGLRASGVWLGTE